MKIFWREIYFFYHLYKPQVFPKQGLGGDFFLLAYSLSLPYNCPHIIIVIIIDLLRLAFLISYLNLSVRKGID